MFATDRDLLVLEPNLFRDAAWIGQRLVSGTGSVTNDTLSLTSQDVNFSVAGVTAGHVAAVDGVPYEVIERTSNTNVTISRLRASAADPIIRASPATARPVAVVTFGPQIEAAHRRILRLLGIDPDLSAEAAAALGAATEAMIVNASALRLAECFAALHLVYAAVSALETAGGPLSARAEWHRARFAEERGLAAARLDLDGDGLPDATRRLNQMVVVRA